MALFQRFLFSPRAILLAIGFLLIFLSFKNRLSGDLWRYSIHSDGKGYYAFLPALFIYQSSDFEFVPEIEKRYYDPGNYVYFVFSHEGQKLNKYWSGVALLMLPFFGIAHALALLFDLPADGYSFIYQASVSVAAIFWALFGIYALFKLLLDYFGFTFSVVSFSVISVLFGTNLLYYTIWEPSMSHVYSFSSLSVFLWQFSVHIRKGNTLSILLSAFFAGCLVLIRPTNVILLFFVFFLFPNQASLTSFLKSNFQKAFKIIPVFLIFCSVIFVQFFYFKWISKEWWVDTYPGEGFNFSNPEFFNFLVSFRKGLWLYTPLCFVSLLGIGFLLKDFLFRALVILILLIGYTYVLSSWGMWYYGGSLGMRPVIDSFAILGFLIASLVSLSPNTPIKGVSIFLILLSISANLIFTYQYTHWILPWDGMNAEKFWQIFLCFSQDCAAPL